MNGRDIFSFKLFAFFIPFLVYESISNLKTKTLDLVEWFVYNSCNKRQRENGMETVSSENSQKTPAALIDSVGSVFDIV